MTYLFQKNQRRPISARTEGVSTMLTAMISDIGWRGLRETMVSIYTPRRMVSTRKIPSSWQCLYWRGLKYEFVTPNEWMRVCENDMSVVYECHINHMQS